MTPTSTRRGAGRAITVTATGYALPGTTATGLPVGWGVVGGRPVRDPARHAHDDPRLRRGGRGRHGRRGRRRDDRSLVPDRSRRRTPGAGARSRSCCTRLGYSAPRSEEAAMSEHRRHRGRRVPRVLLVDDHDLFRTGLRNLLEEQGVAGRRRGRRPATRRCGRPRARARRRRHGPEHARDQRRRGDAPDLDDRAAHPRPRAHDLRPGQRRDGRDPRRCVRLPAQGRVDRGADARASARPRSASRWSHRRSPPRCCSASAPPARRSGRPS